MNKIEFKEACTLAIHSNYGTSQNMQIFNGFGLKEYQPIACTLKDMCGLIKWQCLRLNGSVDTEALDEIWSARKKFMIVDY